MDRPKPLELMIFAMVLMGVGLAIVVWDALYVVAPLWQRAWGGTSELAPTALHNLRTMMTGAFAGVVGLGLARGRAWSRRAAVAACWAGAAVLGGVLAVAPFGGQTAFVVNAGGLVPLVNAPYLFLCQLAASAGWAGKCGLTLAVALGVLGCVIGPLAVATYLGTGRVRRATGSPDERLHVGTLVRRELGAYFHSPIAYVVAGVFLLVMGIIFMLVAERTQEASMRMTLSGMGWVMLLMVPFLTMRLLAEEQSSGTIEMLLTAPVTDSEVVVSKFVGAVVFLGILLAPTWVYVLVLKAYANPDMGPIVTGYLGVMLLGGYLVAFGLMVSALVRNQVVAGAVALAGGLTIAIVARAVDSKSVFATTETSARARRLVYRFVEYVGMMDHLDSFTKGAFDQRDVFFYVAFTFLWLFLAVRALESRRWRG